MLDHVIINVADLASRAFYEAALRPLGWEVAYEQHGLVAFASERRFQFWLAEREPPAAGTHVAFAAPDRAAVDAFYEAGLAAGGRDNGPPGLRPHYHEHYYSAFLLDPGGNNVEAVCHRSD